MEEKELIRSQQYNPKKGLIIFPLAVGILIIMWAFLYSLPYYSDHRSWAGSIAEQVLDDIQMYVMSFLLFGGIAAVISLFIWVWLKSYSLVVTNKRIYGYVAFSKRVDLPLDMISAVSATWLKGIGISTSSGRIFFMLIKNQSEVHKCISDLLIQRQTNSNPLPVQQATPMHSAEELKKYKELLDSGVITQAEFDAKKKQLLGL